MPQRNDRHLTQEQLRHLIEAGEIDTVVTAFTDMQGRLQGKRFHAHHFLDHVAQDGTEGCDYLLAVDVDMNTVDGYATSGWDKGYGDMEFVLDWDTTRRVAHQPGTAMIQCDLIWPDHRPVDASPRGILRRQLERLAEHGWKAYAGTELEFIVFENTYEDAIERDYHGLTPANRYNVDYSLLGTARIEPLLRELRNSLYESGLNVESAKGECNFGQHEIGFLYDEALVTADNHAFYKNAAKEIAATRGESLTFMAKYDEREGSSCHIHLSLRGDDGSLVFTDDDRPGGRSELYERFIAGVLATAADFTLLYAPNINSYKRFADGTFAPTTIGWGQDNRTCAVRLVGHGAGARMENRVPGADVNPYLALAAMIAGGLHGIEQELTLEAPVQGNAYATDKPRVPHNLAAARDAFRSSVPARTALGDDVVDHYAHMAEVEVTAFGAAVTDWERRRGFERL